MRNTLKVFLKNNKKINSNLLHQSVKLKHIREKIEKRGILENECVLNLKLEFKI